MTATEKEALRAQVREWYGATARRALDGTGGAGAGCCSGGVSSAAPAGAGNDEPTEVPFAGALASSLGCGNPTALAELSPGQDVLDLGSGGGLDVLLSARRISPGGTAYGLDMTPEMLELAERNRAEAGVPNARFLLGTIECIPLPDASIDTVVSNCVINLAADKDAVFREAHRVLRPGGRFAVADIVLLRPIPEPLRRTASLWTGCMSGALRDSEYLDALRRAGFQEESLEVTRVYGGGELDALLRGLGEQALPAGWSRRQAFDALDGAIAAAFIRARTPGL